MSDNVVNMLGGLDPRDEVVFDYIRKLLTIEMLRTVDPKEYTYVTACDYGDYFREPWAGNEDLTCRFMKEHPELLVEFNWFKIYQTLQYLIDGTKFLIGKTDAYRRLPMGVEDLNSISLFMNKAYDENKLFVNGFFNTENNTDSNTIDNLVLTLYSDPKRENHSCTCSWHFDENYTHDRVGMCPKCLLKKVPFGAVYQLLSKADEVNQLRWLRDLTHRLSIVYHLVYPVDMRPGPLDDVWQNISHDLRITTAVDHVRTKTAVTYADVLVPRKVRIKPFMLESCIPTYKSFKVDPRNLVEKYLAVSKVLAHFRGE